MSGCPNRETLANLLRQKLVTSERLATHAHIATCTACQQVLDELTQLPPVFAGQTRCARDASDTTLIRLIGELQAREPADPDQQRVNESANTLIGKQLGGYQIVREIARGGSGTLYHAIDPALHRDVAIKLLHTNDAYDAASAERISREARAIAAIDHPNVVRLFGLANDDRGRPFLVMEYVDGETLADRLEREATLLPRRAAAIVRDLAQALAAAHAKSLIHRDVKPSNVLLKGDHAKLTDFGLVLDEDRQTRLTREGMIAGTPNYMSPEQIQNPHFVDHRTDVYSLGTVLYELLTGQTPFRGVQRMTLLQILHDEPRPPRQLNDAIPSDLETICLKAMSKEPSRRYATAIDLANDLDSWLAGRAIAARPVSAAERLVRWCRRNSRVAILLVSICLLLASLAAGGTVAALRMRALKQLADQQRDVAFDTLRSMVFDVYDRLDEEDDPAIYAAQRQLLRLALAGLDRLPPSVDVTSEIDWTRLAAMARRGSIEYRLGNRDEAREQLNDVLRLCTELGFSNASADHVDYRHVRPLSHAHFYLGALALQDHQMDDALTHFETSMQLDESLVAVDPERIDFQLDLVSSIASLVQTTFAQNDAERCLTYAARCEALIQQIEAADEAKEYEAALTYLPDVLRYWGILLERRGELPLARQKLSQGEELLRDEFEDDEQLDVQAAIVASLITLERREGNLDRAAELTTQQQSRFDKVAELAEDLEDDELLDWVEVTRAEFQQAILP